jgi:hypothetical protein
MTFERADAGEKPQKNPGGASGYVLTPEDRAKGLKKAVAKSVENRRAINEQRNQAGKVAALAAQARGVQIGQTIDPPKHLFHVIEVLGKLRLATDAKAAEMLGISEGTWRAWRTTYPEIKEAWSNVKRQEEEELVDKLYRSATGQLREDEQVNIVSAMFLLKARHGYRDQGSDVGGGVTRIGTMNNVQIVLPGSQSRADWLRSVNSPVTPPALPAPAEVLEGDAGDE